MERSKNRSSTKHEIFSSSIPGISNNLLQKIYDIHVINRDNVLDILLKIADGCVLIAFVLWMVEIVEDKVLVSVFLIAYLQKFTLYLGKWNNDRLHSERVKRELRSRGLDAWIVEDRLLLWRSEPE